MKRILKALIKAYRYLVSPFLGRNCRFHPSCSAYTQQAIETHGALTGSWLGLKRICKCHPYYKGSALDPVPPAPVHKAETVD